MLIKIHEEIIQQGEKRLLEWEHHVMKCYLNHGTIERDGGIVCGEGSRLSTLLNIIIMIEGSRSDALSIIFGRHVLYFSRVCLMAKCYLRFPKVESV